MDAVLLARIQFGFTVGFHYLFPPLTIGMAWLLVWIYWRFLRTGDEIYQAMGRFWLKLFTISFAIGVATGIVMEFQFGTNWAQYSRFVGDIFGAPLAAEGLFAFFLESTFLGVLLFGEKKVSRRFYVFSALMVAVGSTLSAFWIIVANSWQQTPAGYELVNGRAELVDFWAAVFNPSTIERYTHTVVGCLVTGSFFMMSISAWYLLKKRFMRFAKLSFRIGLIMAFVSSVMMLPLGHFHAVQVAETQPAKLAAIEGHWETSANAPMLVFGIPNEETETTDYAIELPGMLSIGVGGSRDTVIRGLKDFPKELRPPLFWTFYPFHIMVALGMFFIGLTTLGMFLLLRSKDCTNRPFLYLTMFSVPLPFIANEVGWISAEVGRQPWAVYGLIKTADSISVNVPAWQVLASLVMFGVLYLALFALWIMLLTRKITKGPIGVPEDSDCDPPSDEQEVKA